MCSHYQTLTDAELLFKKFGVTRPGLLGRYDMWPRYPGVFIRRPVEHDADDEAVPEREAVVGRWGLISAMTKVDGLDKAGKLSTFTARSETAAKSFTFGNAWRQAQHCIIPADAIFEPDWRSGAAVATRFTRADGAPLGIAGLMPHSLASKALPLGQGYLITEGKLKQIVVPLSAGEDE